MPTKHQETHPGLDVEGCWGCKVSSISVAPSATPSRKGGAQAAAVNETEKQWDVDMRSYKSLRAQGIQPRSIDGCDALSARAADKFEVEAGHVLKTKEQREQAREGIAMVQELTNQ